MNYDFSPGVHDPLCGWDWVFKHKDDVVPQIIELSRPGSRYVIKAHNADTAIKAVKIAVNK